MSETNEKLSESQRKARAATAKKLIEESTKPHENNSKSAPEKTATKKTTLRLEAVEPEKHKLNKKDIARIIIFVIAGFFLALMIMPYVIDDFRLVIMDPWVR